MFKIYDGRSHFYQWDIDRKLIVEDTSISEVHFCNQTDNYSLVCKTYIEDGLNLVNVPNILLQNDWRINVYAYDSNYTKFSERFDVIKRCKPEDYVYTETEILNYNTLSDRIDAVDKNIGETIDNYLAEHSSDIETAINTALTQAKASGEFDGADGITPTIGDNGNWFLGDVDTNKPSRGEKGETGAQGEKGADGATGATGADGKSAYSYAQDGGYTGTEKEFAAKLVAEKLPNPYPLTFTGAVSETYDGSSAKTIEIPSGGGGAFTASYTVEEEVTSYTLNIDTSKYSGYAIFIRNSTNKAPSVTINREHKRVGFTGYDANTNFFDINIVHNDSDDLLQGFCKLQKNNNTSAVYCSYGNSNHASGATEENNGIIITAETIGAGSEIFVRCI